MLPELLYRELCDGPIPSGGEPIDNRGPAGGSGICEGPFMISLRGEEAAGLYVHEFILRLPLFPSWLLLAYVSGPPPL